jgi:hypothetical protein
VYLCKGLGNKEALISINHLAGVIRRLGRIDEAELKLREALNLSLEHRGNKYK